MDEAVIRSDPNRTVIPSLIVDAVCHVPYCAHPSYTQGYYDRDNDFYLHWDEISKTKENVTQWLQEYVFDVRDHSQYWQKLGNETHQRLKIKDKFSTPINYGEF